MMTNAVKLALTLGAVGVGVVGLAVVASKASAAPALPAPGTAPLLPATPAPGPIPLQPTGRSVQPVADGSAPGSRTFNAGVADSGSAVQMAVGDLLNITLPTGPGLDWFAFGATGAPALAYQGLTLQGTTTAAVAVGGGTNETFQYKATASLGPLVVQIIFQLLATNPDGTAQAAAANQATFTLWVAVA